MSETPDILSLALAARERRNQREAGQRTRQQQAEDFRVRLEDALLCPLVGQEFRPQVAGTSQSLPYIASLRTNFLPNRAVRGLKVSAVSTYHFDVTPEQDENEGFHVSLYREGIGQRPVVLDRRAVLPDQIWPLVCDVADIFGELLA